MAIKYLWQRSSWPNFTWDTRVLLAKVGKARQVQGRLLSQADIIGLEAHADLVVEEAFATSAIEGEKYDRKIIRSSVARRLGLPTAGLPPSERRIDGLVEMLLDATTYFNKALTAKRLHGWQAGLFPTGYSGIHEISVGNWRQSKEPMRVISGAFGRETIHYEAPPSAVVAQETKKFLHWWNHPPAEMDGLIRAGVAHFWFVSIHPYDDGNGRVSRAITDMALSQDEQSTRRLYNLSTQIIKERSTYYDTLEEGQKGSCDITEWLDWFLSMYVRAIGTSREIIAKALFIAKFWQVHQKTALSSRQLKVVQKMLEAEPQGFEGGINNRKYVSITGISAETAKRDLANLEEKGILTRLPGGGRSTGYSIDKSRC
jgi:Fic family protein